MAKQERPKTQPQARPTNNSGGKVYVKGSVPRMSNPPPPPVKKK